MKLHFALLFVSAFAILSYQSFAQKTEKDCDDYCYYFYSASVITESIPACINACNKGRESDQTFEKCTSDYCMDPQGDSPCSDGCRHYFIGKTYAQCEDYCDKYELPDECITGCSAYVGASKNAEACALKCQADSGCEDGCRYYFEVPQSQPQPDPQPEEEEEKYCDITLYSATKKEFHIHLSHEQQSKTITFSQETITSVDYSGTDCHVKLSFLGGVSNLIGGLLNIIYSVVNSALGTVSYNVPNATGCTAQYP